jgi:hypothetical protein
MFLGIGEGSHGSNPQSSSMEPWGEGGAWPWTLVGNVFRECHAPCTLKTSFVDLKKEQAHFSP